jgi:asparagine synthase (glutamine-hydrolysing)
MCGITGVLAFNEVGRWSSLIKVSEATNQLSHRGPDTGRLYNDYFGALGHRRLAIIDLSSEGWQPMSDPTERYTLVFNGEIYNFKSIRKRLVAKGIEFKSDSDTEVLLHLYIEKKEAALEELDGFFSFAVFDKDENTLFLARDRFGIKPLLYYYDEDRFIFASEMKSLLSYNIPKEVDYASLRQYFQLHYIPAPDTIFKNVFKLPAGSWAKIKKRDVQVQSYYKAPYPQKYQPASYQESQKELVSLLENSVKNRLMSDVPLGAFLSGGTDSSAVVALASRHTEKLNTFSIGYRDEPLFDETKYAELVAKKFNTSHHAFQLSNNDIFDAVFKMLDFLGEPFADSSAIPTYILSQETKKKVSVSLSGDGADELFGGYNKYLGEFKARQGGFLASILKNNLSFLNKLPKSRNTFFGNKFRQLHRFSEAMQHSEKERYWYLSSFLSESKTDELFSEKTRENIDKEIYQNRKTEILSSIKGEDFNEVLYSDVKLLLGNDMLQKVDSMSMAHGLEVRVPFLDHKIVDFAFSLPSEYKINSKMKKRVVQDAFADILPKELYNRPKHGFDVPLTKGYKTVLKTWIEELFDPTFVEEQGIFSPEYLDKLKYSIFNTNDFDQNHVWAILVFQHWWKANF